MAEVNFNLTGNNEDLVKNMEELRKVIGMVNTAVGQLQPKMETLFKVIEDGAKESAKGIEEGVNKEMKKTEEVIKEVYKRFLEKRDEINNDTTLSEDKRTKKLSELTIGNVKKEFIFEELLGDLSDYSLGEMQKVVGRAEAALQAIKAGDKAKAAANGANGEVFDDMLAHPEKIEEAEKGVKSLRKQVEGFDGAFKQIGKGFSKIFESGSDAKDVQEGLALIEKGLNKVMEAGKYLSDTLSGIGEAFGNDTLKEVAQGINVAMDTAKATMSGAKAGMAVAGPWGAVAGAAVGLVSSLTTSLAKLHDAKHQKKIEEINKEIKELERTYKKLEKEAGKSYSGDAVEVIDEENKNLEQQKALIQSQIAEEKSKKKVNKDAIKEWENSISDINDKIAENKERQIDALMGSDVKAAINDFAQAYADAWAAGSDRAKSSTELVKNMIKQMVMEALKMASAQPMEELRKKLVAAFENDNIIDSDEQQKIESDAKALMEQLDSKFSWANRFMVEEKDQSREASARGIATASQESVDENNGRLTVIQEHTYGINESVKTGTICLANIDKTMTSMMTLQGTAVLHLSNIENNTARLATIEQAMFSIKTGIDTLNTNGLTLKR